MFLTLQTSEGLFLTETLIFLTHELKDQGYGCGVTPMLTGVSGTLARATLYLNDKNKFLEFAVAA